MAAASAIDRRPFGRREFGWHTLTIRADDESSECFSRREFSAADVDGFQHVAANATVAPSPASAQRHALFLGELVQGNSGFGDKIAWHGGRPRTMSVGVKPIMRDAMP